MLISGESPNDYSVHVMTH